jgi:hypothetical protein
MKEDAMEKWRNLGLAQIAAGLAALILAVLLFGLTKDGGGVDWVSIITAIAGGVLALTGLYTVYHNRRPTSFGT